MRYVITLEAPDCPPELRAELEDAIRAEIDAQYGSHAAAAGALHAHWDSMHEESGIEPMWPVAFDTALQRLADRLPPDARVHWDLYVSDD